jgi:CRISPR-associated endonuclease/helicase Cas3
LSKRVTADDGFFENAFVAMTGSTPFPWQRRLFACLSSGQIPTACRIPTGLGKTAVIPVWLIALASSSGRREESDLVPRRLVYIVNRRTVVDQATDEAEKIRRRLESEGSLAELRSGLESLGATKSGVPLAISTLRGEFADNREWSADPSRPAVILGTVDMIGSRLLFSGYGIGFKTKPLHAGVLGQDALLVHDEAHLEPAFQKLLSDIKIEQARCKEFRRFHVMELTATSRGDENSKASSGDVSGCGVLGLTDEDRRHPTISQRINATKTLILHPEGDEKSLVDRLVDLALQHQDSGRAILIFARTVEVVERVAEKLRKAGKPCETLTGTMRGKERDDLVKSPVFQRFLPDAAEEGETVYLVCTSAGEVGVNISADHLVCDLSTFESTAQRFGRVNRFGKRSDTRVDVVHPTAFEKDDLSARLEKTLELLRKLQEDASPAALDKLDSTERVAAFSPQPECLDTSDILFDKWSLTSLRAKLPGRPPVEPFLHGITDYEPARTQVVWREEVGVIDEPLREKYPPEELLEDYPIKPHEILRDRSDRVFKHLASLSAKQPDAPAWLVEADGTVSFPLLRDLADKDKKSKIENCTVVLPPSVGGLQRGMLTGNSADAADDVADTWPIEGEIRRLPSRTRIWDGEAPPGMRLVRVIDTRPDADEEGEVEAPKRRFWRWYVEPRSADDDGTRTSRGAVLWDVHTNDVVANATRTVEHLPLPEYVRKAVTLAARLHDLGKKRVVWQRSIGNRDATKWFAKSGGTLKPIELTDYRHEFGSLLDAKAHPEFRALNEDERDLVLHMIAAHHGMARPHFSSDDAFDVGTGALRAEEVAAEVPVRFARLQTRFGRWGLAYLESLLRAADYAASASPSETEAEK